MAKIKQNTRADLVRKIQELEAQLLSSYGAASAGIGKASTDHFMASGVIVRVHALGGREIVPAFMVADGLSLDTVAALRADIKRSYELTKLYNENRIIK